MIQGKTVGTTTVLELVAGAKHVASTVRGGNTTSVERVAAVTLSSVLDRHVGETGTSRGADIECHRIRSESLASESSTLSCLGVAVDKGVVADDSWLSWTSGHRRRSGRRHGRGTGGWSDGWSDRRYWSRRRRRRHRRGHRRRDHWRSTRVDVEPVTSTAELGGVTRASHRAVGEWSRNRTSTEGVTAEALVSVLDTGVSVALAEVDAVGDGVVVLGVLAVWKSSRTSTLGVTSQTGPSVDSGVGHWSTDRGSWRRRSSRRWNHLASRVVVEERDVRAGGVLETVTTADLVDIAGTSKVAVALVDLEVGDRVGAPALSGVLGSSVSPSSIGTSLDTHLVGVGVSTPELSLHLSTGVVVLVAPLVSEVRRAVGVEWRGLLSDGVAGKLDHLFTKVRVAQVQGPSRSAGVGVEVVLALWGGAEQGRSRRLSRSEGSTFGEIDLVDSTNDTWNTEWRLGDSDRESSRRVARNIGESHLEVSRRVLEHITKGEWSRVAVRDPSGAIRRLELDQSRGVGTSNTQNVEQLDAPVRGDLDESGVVARGRWVEVDVDRRLAVTGDDLWDLGDGETAAADRAVDNSKRGEWTSLTDGGALHLRDGEVTDTQVEQDSRLAHTTSLLSGDDTIERYRVGSNTEESALTLTDTLQSDGDTGRVLVVAGVGGVDQGVGGKRADLEWGESRLERELSTSSKSERKRRQVAEDEVLVTVDTNAVDLRGDVGSALNSEVGRRSVHVDGTKVVRRRAVDWVVDGRAETVERALKSSVVDHAITKHRSTKLGSTRDVERLDQVEHTVLRDSVVDPQVGTFDVGNPDETGTGLITERSDCSMTNTEDVGVLLWGIGDLGERGDSGVTGKLEDVCLVLDDVDVDVTTFTRVNTSTSVDRVLVLVDLKDGVELVGTVLVTTHVVEVDPVGLAGFTSDDTDSLDVAARELTREDLERGCTEILVGTVELSLLPRHEEVDWGERTVTVDGHVDSGLLESSRWVSAVDGDTVELRGVSVSSSIEHGASSIGRKTTTRHPDTSTGDSVLDASTFGSEPLDDVTGRLVPTHDPSGKVPLDTVRSETGVDVLTLEQEGRSLVVDTAVERSRWVVSGDSTLEVDWEAGSLGQVVDADGVEVVSSVGSSLGTVGRLVDVGLGGEVPGVGAGVDDTSGSGADVGVDVNTTIEVGGEERNVEVPRGDNHTGLGVELVDVVLLGSEVDVLDVVTCSVDEGRGKDLLGYTAVSTGEIGFEDLTKLGGADNSWIHVMVAERWSVTLSLDGDSLLVSRSGVVTTPGGRVCRC